MPPLNEEVRQNIYGGWNDENAIQNDWREQGAKKWADYQSRKSAPATPAAPAVSPETIKSVETAKTDTKAAYDKLIESIKGKQQYATQQSDIATAQEYGKRGILPSSGVVQDVQRQRGIDIGTQYGGLEAQATTAGVGAQNDLTQFLAQLQSGSSENAANRALQLQLAQMSKEPFAADLQRKLLEAQISSTAGGGANRYTTLGEGQTLFDMLTGQAAYTAPKTYKSATGGGGDSLGLY